MPLTIGADGEAIRRVRLSGVRPIGEAVQGIGQATSPPAERAGCIPDDFDGGAGVIGQRWQQELSDVVVRLHQIPGSAEVPTAHGVVVERLSRVGDRRVHSARLDVHGHFDHAGVRPQHPRKVHQHTEAAADDRRRGGFELHVG